jgi:hypothetical protein
VTLFASSSASLISIRRALRYPSDLRGREQAQCGCQRGLSTLAPRDDAPARLERGLNMLAGDPPMRAAHSLYAGVTQAVHGQEHAQQHT